MVWEKRLVECPTALLKNRLRHASYKKSNSSHEVRRGRRAGRPLRRRASDNFLSQSAAASPLPRARWSPATGQYRHTAAGSPQVTTGQHQRRT